MGTILIDIMKFTVILICVCACVWWIKDRIDFPDR